MTIKITLALFLMALLSSCIKVSGDAPTSTPILFVTATLPPTKPGLRLPTEIPPTALPTSDLSTPNATSAACKDVAVLIADVSYPDNTRLTAGEKFTKTWKIQNTGTCKWTGYTAAFISGDKMEAPDSVPVSETGAKATVEVSIDLVAPSNDGAFTGLFELRNAAGKVVPIGTPQDALNQWRSDPGHWEFVLNPYSIEVGLGYVYCASSDFGGYFTVDFASP